MLNNKTDGFLYADIFCRYNNLIKEEEFDNLFPLSTKVSKMERFNSYLINLTKFYPELNNFDNITSIKELEQILNKNLISEAENLISEPSGSGNQIYEASEKESLFYETSGFHLP